MYSLMAEELQEKFRSVSYFMFGILFSSALFLSDFFFVFFFPFLLFVHYRNSNSAFIISLRFRSLYITTNDCLFLLEQFDYVSL